MDLADKRTEVIRLCFEVKKSIKHCMRSNFHDAEITLPQSMVLRALIENGEISLTELCSKTNSSNSTISGIIDRLEKQQLVIRTRKAEDRRTVYVKVTPKVYEVCKGNYINVEETFENLLSRGSPEDIEKILVGLTTLKTILIDTKE